MTDGKGNPGDDTQTGEHRVLRAGTVLADRYEIEELVGMGGMGMVYRARDRRLDVEVAVKLLNADRAADPETLERFERELVLARQVTHPNVVRIHDIGQDGDRHFLTMDFVPGRSLKAVLEEEGALEPDRVAAIGRDLASALSAAHEKGVVHRDLKPANVLVDSGDRARITDFGVARSLSGRGPTRTGHVLGTPDYLSPEQALGEEVDGRSDVYALGLVLFEMVSGELPFSADSFEESLAQRIAGRARDLDTTGANVPAWMKTIIARCLERDPDDRYPDARELEADLAAHAASRPRRRRHWHWAAVGAVALAAVLGISWLLYPPPAGRDSDRGVTAVDSPAGARTVAVLPFADETGRPTLAWVSTGVPEMVAVDLAQAPALEVVDSLRVFRTVRDLGLRPGVLAESEARQLAGLLDAEFLVMGRVRSAGEGLELDARLSAIGSPGGGAERFGEAVPGAGAIQIAAGRLTAAIRDHLEAGPAPETERVLSSSTEAMAAYGEGVDRLARGDPLAAVAPLAKAVEEDPGFAAAWVRLADAHQATGYRDRAVEAAARAVEELDNPAGRIALEARAMRASLEGNTEDALKLRRDLVQRYPNDMEARVRLGELQGDSGQLDAARETLSAVVEQDPSHPRAWYLLGKFSILAGESRRAVDDYLVRALVVQNRLDNPQGKADVLNAMGIAYTQVGELEQAEEQYARAAEIRREIGDRRGVAATLSNLARIRAMRGQYESASEGLAEALTIQQELGDRFGVAYLHNERGILEEEQGHYREALDHYRDGLRVRRDLGDSRALAESLNNVGYTYFLLGEYDNASVYIQQALEKYREDDNREGIMLARETLAQLEIARGNWDRALEAALATLEAARELGITGSEAVAQGAVGRVAHYQGRYEAALSALDDALAIVTELGDPRGIAEFQLARGEVLLELGAVGAAGHALDAAETGLEDGGNREQRAGLIRQRGAMRLLAGDTEGAIADLERAVTEARASGSIPAHLQARLDLARARLAAGRVPAALEALDAVSRESDEIGHAALRLGALEALARAQRRAGDGPAALTTVRRALEVAAAHAPWGRHWRLYRLHGDLLRAAGNSADEAFGKAQAELDRVRANVPEAHRPAFDANLETGVPDEQGPGTQG